MGGSSQPCKLCALPPLLKELSQAESRGAVTRTRSNHPWKFATYTDFVYVCRSDSLALSLSLNGGPRNADEPSRDCAQTFIALIPLQKEPLCLLRSSDLADCNLSHGPPSQSFREGRSKRYSTTLQHPPQTLPARSTLLRTLSRELGRTRPSPGFGAERKPSHCTVLIATYADFAYVHELREFARTLFIASRARPLDEARALSARPSLLLREHRELSTEHQLLRSPRA